MDVGEDLTALLQENDGAAHAKLALKQPHLVDDVFSSMKGRISVLIFSGHHEEGKGRGIKHLSQALCRCHASHRFAVELVPWQGQAVVQEVFQLAPQW